MRVRSTLVAAVALGTLATLAACTGDPAPEPSAEPTPSPTSGPDEPAELTVGVFGPPEEVEGFDAVVRLFNAQDDDAQVTRVPWANHEDAQSQVEDEQAPDVFMISRRDLATLQEREAIQPVDELLDERGVDFGDGYARDALRAFSDDNALQCMPYGISPMVIYYNTDLVDFERMAERGLPVPPLQEEDSTRPGSWTFDEFSAAAGFATRPRRGTVGVSIDPTLRGLAPFVLSGGGQIFDDDITPTTTTLSSEDSREALETTLTLLRDPTVTLSSEQLAEQSAVKWFEEGKVAMIAGFRDLVPRFRQVQGLDFDVMRMPTIEETGTIGDITGLCISAETEHTAQAADFLSYVISPESLSRIVRTGYLVPANLEVASSDVFLQPGRLPANSRVFNAAVTDIYIPPLLTSWTELEETVAPGLAELFTVPVLDSEGIEEITTGIDEDSRPVLAPEAEPTESPSG